MKKDVALVLSSGGPRGFAYIGAIEELEERGYNITSIAGTSIGSLIGGMYAAGKLKEVKQWLFDLNKWKVFSLLDISLSKSYLVKGDKVINALQEIVPKVFIQDLKIPYKAIATDLLTGEEVIFENGDLFEAIRASISIPSLFRPVKYGNQILVDGGLVNTLPLDRIDRNGQDLLIAFDVNGMDVDSIHEKLELREKLEKERLEADADLNAQTKLVIDSVKNNEYLSTMDKIKLVAEQGKAVVNQIFNKEEIEEDDDLDVDSNYFTILTRSFDLMNHVISKKIIELYPPDLLVSMSLNTYGSIPDYAKAKEISELGRKLMKEALDRFESQDTE